MSQRPLVLNRAILVNCGKLLFLAGWGLALGACMNDASAQGIVTQAALIAL